MCTKIPCAQIAKKGLNVMWAMKAQISLHINRLIRVYCCPVSESSDIADISRNRSDSVQTADALADLRLFCSYTV